MADTGSKDNKIMDRPRVLIAMECTLMINPLARDVFYTKSFIIAVVLLRC